MLSVFKYRLDAEDRQWLDLPDGDAEPLCVQAQDGVPTLWCRMDTAGRPRRMRIDMVGTEHKAPADGTYLSTVQMAGGRLVFHFFWCWE